MLKTRLRAARGLGWERTGAQNKKAVAADPGGEGRRRNREARSRRRGQCSQQKKRKARCPVIKSPAARRKGTIQGSLTGVLLGSRYRLAALLGQGGMGSVHEAIDERTGTKVAVKVLHTEILKDGSSKDDTSKLSRFQREAKASASIQSEHIVRMLDWGTDEATAQPFMVMELLEGEDLQQLLKRASILPPDVVLRIGAQACAGLAKAHEARVMHRDIKPANLFLTRTPAGDVTVKLLDFGIAKFRPDGSEELGETTNLTRTGSMLGSPRYMSPEQARGSKALDHRTDIWSVGVVMYRALTGHMPHEDAEAMGDFIVLLCSEPPRSILSYSPWVPPEIAAVVEGALQIDRDKRYPTATAMLDAIRAFLPAGDRIAVSDLVALPESARSNARPHVGSLSGMSSNDATVPIATARGRQASVAGSASARREDAGTPGALAATHNDTRDDAKRKPMRAVAPFVIGAAVLVLGLGGVAILRAPGSGDAAPAASTTSSGAAPSLRKANLVVLPGDVAVEVNGSKVSAPDGVVEIAGAIGSVHKVRISREGQEKVVDVVLGEAGAEPAKIELSVAGGAAPSAPTTGPGTTSAASTGGRLPTKKTATPGATSAPTGPKNPLMPEKFE